MNSFINKIRNFMIGRYGIDTLNFALMIMGCVLTFILSLFRVKYGTFISLIPYAFAIYRMLSRDYAKRRAENERFVRLITPWKNFIRKKIAQFQDKDHKYYNCPQCHNTLRVPKGRGKIKISCPHCSKEFVKRT